MFKSGLKESITNQMEIIDFSFETVELALKIIYNQKIQNLTLRQKMGILKFFDKYVITDFKVSYPAVKVPSSDNVLKGPMETSLAEDISFETVVQITNFAILIRSFKIQQRCKDFLVACYNMDRKVEDLHLLDKNFAVRVLKTIFSSCDTV